MICIETAQACHRARWLMIDPDTVIADGYFVADKGWITAVGSGRPPSGIPVMDHGDAVLMPGLVNAHTHLELSAFSRPVDADGGFLLWVQRLMHARAHWTDTDMEHGIDKGIYGLKAGGAAAVGDISSCGVTGRHLADAGLPAMVFTEYLGADRDVPAPESGSAVAGHAPHTTAPDFLTRLKQMSRDCRTPFSLHLAESAVEADFIRGTQGDWTDFLRSRGIDTDAWPLPATSPVQYADRLGLLDTGTLAVHLIEVDAADAACLAATGTFGCICLRSNRYLHGKIPDLPGLLAAGVRLCLGTDSLASTPTLSMQDELAALVKTWPAVSAHTWLTMATVNGARALHLSSRVGRLTPGCRAAYLSLDLPSGCGASPRDACDRILEALVRDHGPDRCDA